MSTDDPLAYPATLDQYHAEADALLEALKSGDEAAYWRFKWEHPRFRGKPVTEVKPPTLEIADAQLVIAREHGFEKWADVAAFADAVRHDNRVARFEAAVEAVVSGDATALRSMLREHPELVRARSARRHQATLLHYIAANGVEGGRQKTPPNAVEIARILLDAEHRPISSTPAIASGTARAPRGSRPENPRFSPHYSVGNKFALRS